MRRVVWAQRALRDLEGIRDYIGQFAPLAAQRFALRLIATANELADHPLRGRPLAGGRRELTIIPPYLIRYRVSGDTVQILTIRHGARQD